METTPEKARWRWPLFLLGVMLFVLGPITLFAQFHFHERPVPSQVPILATLGVVLMAISAWQRGGILRGIGALVFAGLCGLEWFMLLFAMQTPAYAGPNVGQQTPAFATTLANGTAFTNADLAQGRNTVLVFFRGHWWLICMHELGELEKRHEDIARRKVRIIAISNDDEATAQKTQAAFPHLTVVADTQQNLAKAIKVIHAGAGPDGGDTNAPTTLLIDGAGTIRWTFRPSNLATRLTPNELLAAIDTTFPSAH